jgi:pimeloyl-ACP methyl ester carboxylesterase
MAGALPQGRQVIVPGASHAMNYTNPRHLARIIRAVAARSPAGG